MAVPVAFMTVNCISLHLIFCGRSHVSPARYGSGRSEFLAGWNGPFYVRPVRTMLLSVDWSELVSFILLQRFLSSSMTFEKLVKVD